MNLLLFTPLLAGFALAEPPCAQFRDFVYRVRAGGPHFGAGFFLSADGAFLTALHVIGQSPEARAAVVEVNHAGSWLDCPLMDVVSYSRQLDFVIARVRLGSARVRVPPVAAGVRPGAAVFGFRVTPPLPDRFKDRGAVPCTQGDVTAVSRGEIVIRGETAFFVPGSSGSPVLDAEGRVVAIALEMINRNPDGGAPDWSYSSLPIQAALSARKLRRPIPLAEFVAGLQR